MKNEKDSWGQNRKSADFLGLKDKIRVRVRKRGKRKQREYEEKKKKKAKEEAFPDIFSLSSSRFDPIESNRKFVAAFYCKVF